MARSKAAPADDPVAAAPEDSAPSDTTDAIGASGGMDAAPGTGGDPIGTSPEPATGGQGSPAGAGPVVSPAQPDQAAAPETPAPWYQRMAPVIGEVPDEATAMLRLGQTLQQAQHAQQVAQQWAEYYAGQQRSAQQQSTPAQEQQAWYAKQWSPPEFDRRLLNTWWDNSTNDFKAETPPGIRQAYSEHLTYLENWREKFNENPPLRVWEMIQEPLQQLVQQGFQHFFQQNYGQIQSQQNAQKFIADNSSWIFQQDESGQVQRDPFTGQPQASPLGRTFTQHLQNAARQYPQLTEDQHTNIAMTATQNDFWRWQHSQSQQPGQAGAGTQQAGGGNAAIDPKQKFLNGAARRGSPVAPNRTGKETNNDLQTQGTSFIDKCMADLRAVGAA